MKNKIIVKYIILTFVALALSLLLLNAPEIGLCTSCYDLADSVQPFSFLLLSLIPILIILLFTSQEVFQAWKKFAIPYTVFPIILLILPFTGAGGGGGVGVVGSPDGEFLYIVLASLFFIISIFIIAIKSLLLRKKSKNT